MSVTIQLSPLFPQKAIALLSMHRPLLASLVLLSLSPWLLIADITYGWSCQQGDGAETGFRTKAGAESAAKAHRDQHPGHQTVIDEVTTTTRNKLLDREGLIIGRAGASAEVGAVANETSSHRKYFDNVALRWVVVVTSTYRRRLTCTVEWNGISARNDSTALGTVRGTFIIAVPAYSGSGPAVVTRGGVRDVGNFEYSATCN
jgi:hypothetical protein